MVRETRYLYVGNLPDPITQEQITEHFCRHGKIQSVRFISSLSCDNHAERSTTCNNAVTSAAAAAVVAFMDIKCASRAHEAVNVLNGSKLFTLYNESSSVATVSAGDINSAQYSSSLPPSSLSRTLDSCASSSSSSAAASAAALKPGCSSPTGGGNSASSSSPMVQAAISTAAAAGPPGCLGSTAAAPAAGGASSSHASLAVGASSSRLHSFHGSGSARGEGTNGPVHDVHDSYSSSSNDRRIRSRTSTTPSSPQSAAAAAHSSSLSSGINSHRQHRAGHRQRHHHHHHHGSNSSNALPSAENAVPASGTASSSASSRIAAASGGDVWPSNANCVSRSGSVSPLDTGRSRSQGSSCSGSHGHDYDGNDRRTNAVAHSDCRGRTTGSDSSGVSSSGSNGGSSDRKPRGMLIRGFPIRSTDTSVSDGLYHEYKKFGKVTSVKLFGSGDERYAVVSFKRHEDAAKALESSQEKRFFGAKVFVSIHDGYEGEGKDFRPPEAEFSEYHHKATRTLFVGNLDKSVTREVLREVFAPFGCIVDIDLKSGQNLPFAFIQFDNIHSVVKALRDMDGEHINGNKLKLGFGKSMPTQCVWLEGVADTVSEKALGQHFDHRMGRVVSTYIDRQTCRGLVYFECSEAAEWAVGQMRGQLLKDRRLQVDFASRECEKLFIENLEKTGQLRPTDRVEDRVSGRGHPTFTDYQSSRSNSRRAGGYTDSQRTGGDHYNDYIPCGTRVLPIPSRYSSRGSSSSYLPSVPSSTTGGRPDNGRGSLCDGFEHREGASSSSRNSVKYYDNRLSALPVNDTNYVPSDTYDADLKDYGHSQRLVDESLDRRRGYGRTMDSPSGGVHGHTSATSRYSSETLPSDDAFMDRQDSKSQSEWDSSVRTGYKSSSNVKTDERSASRTQRSYSPSDGNDSSSRKSRTSGRHSLRSRTSKSISPIRQRRSKERKDQSPNSRDYASSSWQPENCASLNSNRRSSNESPDRYSARSVEHISRSLSVSHGKGHNSSANVDLSKSRMRNALDDDISPTDCDRLPSRTHHRTAASFEDYNSSVSNDGDRRRFDKDGSFSSKSETVRTVASISSARYKSDYCGTKATDEPTNAQATTGLNHVGVLSRISCVDTGADRVSGSSTPRSKSPVGSDAEEYGCGEPAPSKGSGDEVASLEKEKSHLLSMLKELEECSSGGSEMDGLDGDGRAAQQRRAQRDEVIDLDSYPAPNHHSLSDMIVTNSHLPALDNTKTHCGETKYQNEYSPDRYTELRHRVNTRDGVESKSRRRTSDENHTNASFYGDEDIVDLVSDSSGVCDTTAEFHRRRRVSSDTTGSVHNSGERPPKSKHSYRNRLSGESVDSTNEDSCIPMSPPVSRSSLNQMQCDDTAARYDTGSHVSTTTGSQALTPVAAKNTSFDDCLSSSSGRHASVASRKGSSASDHQPCIIPDSPVTALRGSNVHLPTEPRSQHLSSSTSGSGGRVPLSLPLPRFAAEWKLSRHLVATPSGCSSSALSLKTEAAMLSTQTVVDVRSKEDLVAPFSPGLLSPPATVHTPVTAVKSETANVSVNAAATAVHLSPEAAAAAATPVKTEISLESGISTDVKSSLSSESESLTSQVTDISTAATPSSAVLSSIPAEKCDLSADITADNKKELDKAIREDLHINEVVKPAEASVAKDQVKDEPPSAASDSDLSDMLSPGSPPDGGQSLDDRIRALDEKLNIYNQTTRQVSIPEVASPSVFDYREKYARRRRLGDSALGGFGDVPGGCNSAAEHAAMVKTLLNNSSIFEQDSRRLEQLQQNKRGFSPATSHAHPSAAAAAAFLATADPSSSSLMVPHSRLSALRTASVDQSSAVNSSVELLRRGSPAVSRIGQSDLHLTIPTAPGYTGSWTNAAAGQTRLHSLTDGTPSTPVTGGWSSVSASWASPVPSVVSTVAAMQTPTAQDPAGVRPSTFSHSTPGLCSTPTGACPSLAPSDPRRAVRPPNLTNVVSAGIRHQDSQSSDTCDAWSIASPLTRRDSVSMEPSTPVCKPKEMISPPISILKKPTSSHDNFSNNSKSGDGFPVPDTSSTVAGVKRTAEVAFSKEAACPTPSKVPAKTQKQSEKETDLAGSDKRHAPAVASKPADVKKTTSTSKSSSSSVKTDVKKQDALFSVSNAKSESSKISTGDDGLKSSSAKPSKPHSTSTSSSSTSASKMPLHKDAKSTENSSTSKDVKSAGGNETAKPSVGDISKETSNDSEGCKSASLKTKVLQSKDHNSSKESKDRPIASKEKTVTDEKDKKIAHSTKSSATVDHKHLDKSRERKPDEATKQSGDSTKSSSSKSIGPVTLSKPVPKSSTVKEGVKLADKPSSKSKDVEGTAKDVVAVKTADSKEHRIKKDDNGHTEKSSKADDRGNGKTAVKSSSKDSLVCKSKHSDSKQTGQVDKRSSDNRQKNSSSSKEQTRSSSSSDKSKSMKKSGDSSSSRSKSEKKPEDRREVKALLQETPTFKEEDFVQPYQSMYDMVKRRSNKEREKEDQMKTMEMRAKSLSQIAQASNRRKNKSSKSTGSTLRQTGSDASDDDTSRPDRSRRRSIDSTRTSASSKQASRRLDSSSDSDMSSSDSSSNDSSVPRSQKSKLTGNATSSAAAKSHSNAIVSSSDSNNSSEDEDDDDRLAVKKSHAASNKNAVRKTSSNLATQSSARQAIYTSSSSSSSSDHSGNESDSVGLNQTKKKQASAVSNQNFSKSALKKPTSSASQKKVDHSAKSNSKKKCSTKDSSASSDSDEEKPSIDQKNKSSIKTLKKSSKKTPSKHDLLDSSASESDSETEKAILQASSTGKPKPVKEISKGVQKVADAMTVPSAAKDSSTKSQSQPSGKVEAKTLPCKKKRETTSDVPVGKTGVSDKLKTASVPSSLSNKTVHEPTTKAKGVTQDIEKSTTVKDAEINRQKHGDERSQHILSSPARSEHRTHFDDLPSKLTNEQQKQASRKKSIDGSIKPPVKKYKSDSPRPSLHHHLDDVSHDESLVTKPDNIFEKMEKQDSIEKVCDRDLDKLSPLPDLTIVKSDSTSDNRVSASKSSDLPVFLPADDDHPEHATETPKLAVERLKEESSKVESIDMAVKAIMEFTNVVTPVNTPVKEATTPKQSKPDSDVSVSFIEEPGDAMQSEEADDAGELTAAIESLIEKELEPIADDSPLPPLQVGNVEVVTTAEKRVAYDAAVKADEPQKVRKSSGNEVVVKNAAGTDASSELKKSESEQLGGHWRIGSQQHQHNEENVSSFMSRLSKATAEAVDFAALSSAGRKSSEDSEVKVEPFSSAARLPQSGGGPLFSGFVHTAVSDSDWPSGTGTGSFAIKAEKETEGHNQPISCAVDVHQTHASVLPSPEKKPADLGQVNAVSASEEKPAVVDSHSLSALGRRQEHSDMMMSDDPNNSAEVYEFKDDEEEVKHTLHNRSRKRPGDSDSSEAAVDTPEPKKPRRRANSANTKMDVILELKGSRTPGTPDSASSASVVKDDLSGQIINSASPATVGAVETVGTSSWMTNMDIVIDAVARGEFERGDESDFYANSSQKPRRRGRRSTTEKKIAATPVTVMPPVTAVVGQIQISQPGYVMQAAPVASHSIPASFPLASIDVTSIQRSLASAIPSGKASPKPVAGIPPQLAVASRIYKPVVVSAGGPTSLPPGISAALSPSGTSYQLMLQRPELHLQQMASAVAVGVPDIQQTSTGPILHNKLPSPANHTGRLFDMPGATQPLLIAVSRTLAGGTPSPMTPNDFVHPQLRAVAPPTAASAPSPAAVMHSEQLRLSSQAIEMSQALASGTYRPPVGIIASSAGPLSVSGSIMRPAVDAVTAASSGIVPLGVVVQDVSQLNKIRHLSPEMAVGSYSPHPSGAYIAQLNRAPRPYTAAYAPYSVMISAPETAAPPRMSPVQSNLLDALQQPSRLVEQEQLLHKQRPSLPPQQPPPQSPLCPPVRGCLLPTSAGLISADFCQSPIGLGQHRLPFTMPELRTSVRAEPKSVAVTQSSNEPQAMPLQALTANKQLPAVLEKPSPAAASAPEHGGGSVASRMELPRNASAMLSNSFSGPPGAMQMEYHLTPGGVPPIMLPGHPLVPQQRPEIGTNRFHPAAAVVSRPPSTGPVGQLSLAQSRASVTLPPATSGPPTPSNTTEQTDQLVVNSKMFNDALQDFPKVWHGHLVLKNDMAMVGMYFVAGNQSLVPASLPLPTSSQDPNASYPQLRIGQRMRLDPTQLEQVSRRMMNDGDFSLLLAVPSTRDAVESITQIYNLRSGFINYLLQKQAAGIVNIQEAGSNQAAYVVHIFPPCQFAEQNLNRFVPGVMQRCGDVTTYLMIVITTC